MSRCLKVDLKCGTGAYLVKVVSDVHDEATVWPATLAHTAAGFCAEK